MFQLTRPTRKDGLSKIIIRESRADRVGINYIKPYEWKSEIQIDSRLQRKSG